MPKLEEGWITVTLLAALLTVATWGVGMASWTDGLWVLWPAALVGLFAGLALAKSRFGGVQATLFAIVYGVFTVGFFMCLDADLLRGDWHQRSVELLWRLNNFLYKLIYGGTNRDTLPFPVVVSLIFWCISVLAAWSIFRRSQAWPAVIPGGLGLLVNIYYYLGPVQLDLYLATYVLLALLLVARMSLLTREREWQAARVAYNPEMRFDFLRAGLLAALFGVIVGWAGPGLAASPAAASAWRQVSGPLATVRESWMRLFASVKSQGQNVNDFYGDSLTLGGPSVLDDDPIMDVSIRVMESDRIDRNETDNVPVARFYWRSNAHDTYVDGRWTTEGSEFKEFDPAKQNTLRLPVYQLRQDMRLRFVSFVGASSRLYVAPQPKWVDRPVTFGLLTANVGSDVSSVLSRSILRRGESYEIIASMTIADQQSLRGAGTNYPQWVLDHYLQLPEAVSERTHALARQIVAEAEAQTPYEQATAVTEWLRANIHYSQAIEAPPITVDPIDYLLFTSRTGYCTYYASAEVILLRSLGIPARFAAGFNQGQYDPATGIYHVLERNAHAWPEVFFPGYGWIEFEPTTSEPPLLRPERPQPVDTAGTTTLPEDTEAQPTPTPEPLLPEEDPTAASNSVAATLGLWLLLAGRVLQQAVLIAVGTLAALAALILILVRLGLMGWENLGALGRRVLRWRGQSIPTAIGLAYLNLERAARWMGLRLAEALTPHERAAAVSDAVPAVQSGVETITAQYVAERYSPRPTDADAQAASVAWGRIRLPVWAETARRFVRNLGGDLAERAQRMGRGTASPRR